MFKVVAWSMLVCMLSAFGLHAQAKKEPPKKPEPLAKAIIGEWDIFRYINNKVTDDGKSKISLVLKADNTYTLDDHGLKMEGKFRLVGTTLELDRVIGGNKVTTKYENLTQKDGKIIRTMFKGSYDEWNRKEAGKE